MDFRGLHKEDKELKPDPNIKGDIFYIMGRKEDHGIGCYHMAFEGYKTAAEMGHTEAKYSLAVMFYTGRAVEPNLEEAIKWFRSAAADGHEFSARRVITSKKDWYDKKKAPCPQCDLKPKGKWPFNSWGLHGIEDCKK